MSGVAVRVNNGQRELKKFGGICLQIFAIYTCQLFRFQSKKPKLKLGLSSSVSELANDVAQFANFTDLDLDHITRLQPNRRRALAADAFWSAGGDDVARG